MGGKKKKGAGGGRKKEETDVFLDKTDLPKRSATRIVY